MSSAFPFASISHELRSALANISNLADQLLLNQSYDAEIVNQIKQSSGFLLRVVEGVITEDKSLLRSEVNIEQLIEECLSIQYDHSIEFHVSLDPDVPLKLSICDVIFSRVLRNLIDNVYTHSGAQVFHIRVSREEEHLFLQVEDDGIGIEALQRKNLFSPLNGHSEGHGIGLFLCGFLAHKADGYLRCLSPEPGQCIFELCLPFEAKEANVLRNNTCFFDADIPDIFLSRVRTLSERIGCSISVGDDFPRFEMNTSGYLCIRTSDENCTQMVDVPFFSSCRHILSSEETAYEVNQEGINWLIVEDDPIVMQVTSLMMRAKGFNFSKARSVGECLEKLNSEYDIILIDVFLMGDSGVQLADHIRQQGYCGMIVGVSADQKSLNEAQSFDMTILKPLSSLSLDDIWNRFKRLS